MEKEIDFNIDISNSLIWDRFYRSIWNVNYMLSVGTDKKFKKILVSYVVN